jgi:hypothetical protein
MSRSKPIVSRSGKLNNFKLFSFGTTPKFLISGGILRGTISVKEQFFNNMLLRLGLL